MTDISVPFADEDIDFLPEGLAHFNRMIEDAQHMVEFPDAYNKAEILAKLNDFVFLIAESLKVAAPIMEGTYEIHQLTKDPSQ